MKLSLIATTSALTVTDNRVARNVEEIGERRWTQFHAILTDYDVEFDTSKYLAYGCHCRYYGKINRISLFRTHLLKIVLTENQGNTPLSTMGKGKPVDARDVTCKAHKECLYCARKKFGDSCLGEFVSYRVSRSNGKTYCEDDANTCERAICECDVAFAEAHLAVKNVYDEQYRHVFGHFDPTDQANCPFGSSSSPGSSSSDKQCCNNADKSTSFKLYNANDQKCCSDGSLKELGQFC